MFSKVTFYDINNNLIMELPKGIHNDKAKKLLKVARLQNDYKYDKINLINYMILAPKTKLILNNIIFNNYSMTNNLTVTFPYNVTKLNTNKEPIIYTIIVDSLSYEGFDTKTSSNNLIIFAIILLFLFYNNKNKNI